VAAFEEAGAGDGGGGPGRQAGAWDQL